MKLEIVDYEPCPKWEEVDGTGYCRCGGQWISHEPQLSKTFDLMANIDRLPSDNDPKAGE